MVFGRKDGVCSVERLGVYWKPKGAAVESAGPSVYICLIQYRTTHRHQHVDFLIDQYETDTASQSVSSDSGHAGAVLHPAVSTSAHVSAGTQILSSSLPTSSSVSSESYKRSPAQFWLATITRFN